jgi:hypothetical protein
LNGLRCAVRAGLVGDRVDVEDGRRGPGKLFITAEHREDEQSDTLDVANDRRRVGGQYLVDAIGY